MQFTRKICPNAYAHAKIYFFSVCVCVGVCTFANHTQNSPKSLRACKNNIFQCVYFGKSHAKLAPMLTRMQKIYFFRCVYLQKSQVTFALTNTFFSTHTAQHSTSWKLPLYALQGEYKGIRTHTHTHAMCTCPSPKIPLYSLQWEFANLTRHQSNWTCLGPQPPSLSPHVTCILYPPKDCCC